MKKIFAGLLIGLLLIALVVLPVGAEALDTAKAPEAGGAVMLQEGSEVSAADPLDVAGMMKEAVVLMLFCTGFTSVLKNKLGVSGKWLTAACLLFGMAIGVGYKVAVSPPDTFAGWFVAVLFGFVCGLVTTGVYDAYGNKIDAGVG